MFYFKKKDELISDVVERCKAEKNENEKCLNKMKVKVNMMQKEIDELKANNKAAKQCNFDGNQVRNCLLSCTEFLQCLDIFD